MAISALSVIKVLAGLASLGMILSPSLAIYRIWKVKDVGVMSVFPFVATLANAHVWMIYGYLTRNYYPIFGTFVAGDFIALAYLAIYWRYATDKRQVLRLLVPTVGALIILSIYAILAGLGYTGQTRQQAGSTFGYICDAVAVCLYGAPFERIFQVLKYKSAVFIQLPMVLAGTTNNALWLTYALMVDNWFILAPNMLFLAIGGASITLYVIYNPATHPISTTPVDEISSKDLLERMNNLSSRCSEAEWHLDSPATDRAARCSVVVATGRDSALV